MSSKKSVNRRTLHYFLEACRQYKFFTAVCLILSPLVVIFKDVVLPFAFAEIINYVSTDPSQEEIWAKMLWPAVAVVVGYALTQAAFHQMRCVASHYLKAYGVKYLALKCFAAIEAQSMQFHYDSFSGSLVSYVNRFCGAYDEFINIILWDIFPVVFSVVPTLIVLFIISPLVALAVIGVSAIYLGIAVKVFRKVSSFDQREAKAYAQQTGQLADSTTNIMAVKSYAREEYEKKRYVRFLDKLNVVYLERMRAYVKRNTAFDLVGVLMTAVILFFLLTGSHWFGFSVGTLILVANYCRQVGGHLWGATEIMRMVNHMFGDAREMTKILEMPDDVVDRPGATKLEITKSEVKFDKITFSHEKQKEKLFVDFSLEVKPGQSVGLVGVSGSGKTTLTKLLLRFDDVKAGAIYIDGQDIREVTQESLRKAIAYVPQESSLFHRSVYDNIAYGRPEATREEVLKAAKLAHADEFIEKLPEGYDTLVGERGVKLSGGQRQRVAIARAILKDAPILVLDEATSALDSESEAAIQAALLNLMKGRTSIVVAHRLSTIAGLDKIVVLNDGRIVEQGTHRELLAKNGEYAKLWSRQSGAFLQEA